MGASAHRASFDGEAGVRKKCGTCLLLTSAELSPGCSLVPQLQSVISPSPNLVPFSVSLLGYSYHRFLLPQETLLTIGTCKRINREFVTGRNDTRHEIRSIKCNVQCVMSRTCENFLIWLSRCNDIVQNENGISKFNSG